MKHKILLGALAAAALCGTDAMAQINYQNGDLLAGFRSGTSPDVILDLGNISLFQVNAGPSFNVNASLPGALTSAFGGTSGVTWSVFGVNDTTLGSSALAGQSDPYTIWSTKNPVPRTLPIGNPNSAAAQLPATDIEAIGGNTLPSGAQPGLILNLAPGIVSVDQSVGNYSPDMVGFSTSFEGNYTYNIERTGAGVMDLYEVNPNSHGQYLGNFSLDSAGDLTFNPVPEPSTWAMLGVGVMSLLATRRFRNNNA